MKSFRILVLAGLVTASAGIVVAQDDEARQSSGLPMKIGENSGNTNKGNLSGKITFRDIDPSQPKPIVFVVVYYNGIITDRRPVTESGTYFIQGVPRENVVLSVEVNGAEVGRQTLGPSALGSMRQDFDINMANPKSPNNSNGVISAKDLYSRKPENDKLFQKALAAIKDKKPKNAIPILKQLVADDPKDFIAWTELATVYFREDSLTEAESAYNSALQIKPDFIVALLNLGRVYLAQKQPDKGIVVLTKAAEVDPASADAQHLLGEAYLLAKKGSLAVVHLNEALKLAPVEKAEIHLRLGTLYNAAGMKDRAVAEYKQFLEKVPKYADREKLETYIKENSPK